MALWYLLAKGERRGPYTAEQLKMLWQTGVLRPTDLVSNSADLGRIVELRVVVTHGGKLPEPVPIAKSDSPKRTMRSVRVETIPDTKKIVFQPNYPTEVVRPAPSKSSRSGGTVPAESKGGYELQENTAKLTGDHSDLDGKFHKDIRGDRSDNHPRKSKNKSRRRRYFLVEPKSGKRLGPVSPEEIAALYHAKQITRQFSVQHGDSPRMLPLRSFLKYFGPDGLKRETKSHDLTASTAQVTPSNETSTGRRHPAAARRVVLWNPLILTVFGSFASMAIIGFLVGTLNLDPLPPDGMDRLNADAGSLEKAGSSNKGDDMPVAAPEVLPNRPVRPLVSSLNALEAPKKEVSHAPRRRPISPATSSFSFRSLSGLVGKEVSLGAVSYDIESLEHCQGVKCSLEAKNSAGESVQVSFFRAAFYDALKARKGKATFMVTVGESGATVYLKEVK